MKVLQGYRYSVTANEEVTVTDENGLNLICPAGQQTYFTATCDEVEVSGDAVVTQARGHITIGSGGGGGGEKIAPGEVVLGGTQGNAFIVHLNECKRCPIFIDEELPEGVTFEKLENGIIANATTTSDNYLYNAFPNSLHMYGGIFVGTNITQLPDSIKFNSLIDGSRMFYKCTSLTSFSADLPSLTKGSTMFRDCTSLTSFSSELPSLTSGYYMFNSCTSLTSFSIDLPSLTIGESMFYNCTSLTSFSIDLPSLTNSTNMFYNCTRLASFSSNLSALTNSSYMFGTCYNLRSFSSNLSSLTSGSNMFNGCASLTSFSIDLPSLTSGANMFSGCNLTSFSSNLPSLTDGRYMFNNNNNLTSFSIDLSSLIYGERMFYECKLSSFSSNLSSLTGGYNMFYRCKLDLESVNRIVSTVPSYTSGSHPITIGVNKNEVTQEQQNAANTILVGKGWTVTWQRN